MNLNAVHPAHYLTVPANSSAVALAQLALTNAANDYGMGSIQWKAAKRALVRAQKGEQK